MATAQERPPPPELRPWVAAVWTLTTPPDAGSGGRPAAVTVLPDGCMDLLFRCPAGQGGWAAGNGMLVVTGPDPRPRPAAIPAATVEAGTGFVGIRFRPGRARAGLDADPGSMLGRTVPAGAVSGRLAALEARLSDCRAPDEVAAGLLAGVRALAGIGSAGGGGSTRLPPSRVLAALDLLQAGNGNGIAGLAGFLGVTDRMLRRDILAWTGLSPKRLARILRFQAALSRLRSAPAAPLALLALDAGYADQAHMAREFRDLGGMPPSGVRRPEPATEDVRSVQDRPRRSGP